MAVLLREAWILPGTFRIGRPRSYSGSAGPSTAPRRLAIRGRYEGSPLPAGNIEFARRELADAYLVLRAFDIETPGLARWRPIVKLPDGINTVSGHSAQSRNVCPGGGTCVADDRFGSAVWAELLNGKPQRSSGARIFQMDRGTSPL